MPSKQLAFYTLNCSKMLTINKISLFCLRSHLHIFFKKSILSRIVVGNGKLILKNMHCTVNYAWFWELACLTLDHTREYCLLVLSMRNTSVNLARYHHMAVLQICKWNETHAINSPAALSGPWHHLEEIRKPIICVHWLLSAFIEALLCCRQLTEHFCPSYLTEEGWSGEQI